MTKNLYNPHLPESWQLVPLADLGVWRGGGTPSKAISSFWAKGTIPWVSPKDMKVRHVFDAEDHITAEALSASATNLVSAGSVLVVTRSGILRHSLPVAIAEVDVALNQDLKALSLSEGIAPAYIAYALDCFEQDILHKCTKAGTTVQSIEFPMLLSFQIPIAPSNEQHRIVAEIEKQFTRLDAAVANLRRVQANLKRYRAAVLKAACEGRLVETEAALARAEQRPYEPAAELLQRILRKRRARWEADQLAKMEAAGKPPKDDKWKVKYEEPAAPDTSKLTELPEGWVWSNPETLSTYDENAICAGPFGTIFKAKDFRPSGVPIIFLRHVASGKYLTHKPTFMSTQVWDELFRPYSVWGGELLITKLGDPPGVCAIYPKGVGQAMVTPDVMKMSVNENAVEPQFLMNYFNSEIGRKFSSGAAFGTTRLRLTLQIFREMPVPFPPLTEQRRIATEVERRFSIIDSLEKSLVASLQRAETLRQKVLQDAFTGKLVEQDPHDESASKLLERIKAERLRHEAKEQKKRKEERKTMKKTGKTALGERRKLVEVLREAERPLAPDVLFREAGFKAEEVEAFYDELKQADKDELITEDKRTNGDVYLSARA